MFLVAALGIAAVFLPGTPRRPPRPLAGVGVPARPGPFLLAVILVVLLRVVGVRGGVELLDVEPLAQRLHDQLIVQVHVLVVAQLHVERALGDGDGDVLVFTAALEIAPAVRYDQLPVRQQAVDMLAVEARIARPSIQVGPETLHVSRVGQGVYQLKVGVQAGAALPLHSILGQPPGGMPYVSRITPEVVLVAVPVPPAVHLTGRLQLRYLHRELAIPGVPPTLDADVSDVQADLAVDRMVIAGHGVGHFVGNRPPTIHQAGQVRRPCSAELVAGSAVQLEVQADGVRVVLAQDRDAPPLVEFLALGECLRYYLVLLQTHRLFYFTVKFSAKKKYFKQIIKW